jgi:hypothetical protein
MLGAVDFQFIPNATAILAKPLNLKLYGLAAQQISVFYTISQIELRSAKNFNGVGKLIEQMSAGFANRTHRSGLVGIGFILRHL